MDIHLSIPEHEELLRETVAQVGYPDLAAIDGKMLGQFEQAVRDGRTLVRPRIVYRATPFLGCEKKAILGEGLVLETTNWARLAKDMQGIVELCCFALTLGEELDGKISALGKDDLLRAFILDAFGSALAELFADQAQAHLEAAYASRGLQSTGRFSPGYCDWEIARGQKALFGFLHPETIGLQVAETGLMTPRKSVSAVVIAAKRAPLKGPCHLCARDCSHRRAPFEKKGC